MDKNDCYVIWCNEPFTEGDGHLSFFETKIGLNSYLEDLKKQKVEVTNQSLIEYATVLPKNSLYPDSYDNFTARVGNKKIYNAIADYFVQRTMQNGKIKSKLYQFKEDFDWKLDEWKEEGNRDILIVNLAEGLDATYYYDRDIKKKWGEKESPLFQ